MRFFDFPDVSVYPLSGVFHHCRVKYLQWHDLIPDHPAKTTSFLHLYDEILPYVFSTHICDERAATESHDLPSLSRTGDEIPV
jgi:hypothetical protein